MFWTKGCPNCGGDVCSVLHQYSTQATCIQCGYEMTDAEGQTEAPTDRQPLNETEPAAQGLVATVRKLLAKDPVE